MKRLLQNIRYAITGIRCRNGKHNMVVTMLTLIHPPGVPMLTLRCKNCGKKEEKRQ